MSQTTHEAEAAEELSRWRNRVVKGWLAAYVVHGDGRLRLPSVLRTVETLMRNEYVSQDQLRRLLEEAKRDCLDGFQTWSVYPERDRRLRILAEALCKNGLIVTR